MNLPDAPDKTSPGYEQNDPCDPQGPGVSTEAVRKELQKITSSPEFRASSHLKDFLQFVVEEALNGRAERLKEYAIGVEVFRRADSFDPRIDTIVRTEARRLRLRLAEYYAKDGQSDPIRIEPVKGNYVPSFCSTVLMETKRANQAESDAAHHRYSRYLRRVGRMTEALAQEREAAKLDPVSPLMAATVGIVLEHMGRFDEAITEFKNALTLDSSSSLALKELGMTYIHKGLYEQGLTELRKLSKSDLYAACSLAYGYARSGDEARARQMLGELLKEPEPRASFVAQIYAGLRNKDKTFEWLGKVINNHDPRLFLKTDPVYNFLYSDPRFNDLLRKMNLN